VIRGSDSQELEPEHVTVFAAGINEIQLDAAGTMIYWEDDSQNIMRAPVDGSYIERVVAGVKRFLVVAESGPQRIPGCDLLDNRNRHSRTLRPRRRQHRRTGHGAG
jgi:hypothetical protein